MKIWHKRLHVTAQIYQREHKLPTCVYTHLFNKHFHSSKTNTLYEIATWPHKFPNSDIENIWLWTTYKLKLWENLQKHLAYTDHRIQFRKPKPWTLYELKAPGGCIRLRWSGSLLSYVQHQKSTLWNRRRNTASLNPYSEIYLYVLLVLDNVLTCT